MRNLFRDSVNHTILFAILLAVILPVASVAQGSSGCCVGRVGDVNGIGGDEPTIADVSAMIDAKFIAMMPCVDIIPCMQEADVNRSGGTNPTCADITLGDISILIDYLFITGTSLGLADCPEASSEPTGYLVSNSECKVEGGPAEANPSLSAGQNCVQYDYDGTGTLSLTHVDAVFNCCIDYLTAQITIAGNTITISEGEVATNPCHCLCPYDLQMQIDNLPPGNYRVIVVNPYGNFGPGVVFDHTLDLSQAVSGEHCDEGSSEPVGYLLSNSECKTEGGAAQSSPSAADGESCLQYDYDGTGTLSLTHLDAVFNCCIDYLTAVISIVGNTITITEDEVLSAPCDCVCPYDLQMQVENLPPGEYRIVVEGPYGAGGSGVQFDFTLDLSQAVSGEYCGEGAPALEYIGNTGCLSSNAATAVESSGQTCVLYEYDEFGTFSIYHGMAAFNCCPSELGATFSIEGNTITITEYEDLDQGGCLCLCLFDLEYAITNLAPGEYNFVINGPYLPTGDQPLEFTLDLTGPTNGMHCEARSDYPWGEM